MPMYEYICPNCGAESERYISLRKDADIQSCRDCDATVIRQISQFGFWDDHRTQWDAKQYARIKADTQHECDKDVARANRAYSHTLDEVGGYAN